MEYFVVQLRLADRDRFLLWFQADADGFYVESEKIVSFEREDDAIQYGREQGFKLSGQPATI